MAILTKIQILKYIQEGRINFTPQIDAFQLQPHTIDLRLGYSFYIPKKWTIHSTGRVAVVSNYLDENYSGQDYFDLIKLSPGQYFELLPREFIIASSLEKIVLNDGALMAKLDARSSIMRRGISISSGTIDVKYKGTLTLPITNNTDQIIKIYPGERICHLSLETLTDDLSNKDALLHGNNQSKYHESTPYSLESRPDKKEEIEFIKNGQLEELKNKFQI